MAVRYKFRSSLNFDSVDIDGRPSISIRDLKSKIVHNKKLSICQDFDLLISDALTGREYDDEYFQISSGSSVIIKRMPARSVPSDVMHNGSFVNFAAEHTIEVRTSHPKIEEINFDDFGIDLYPTAEGILSCSDIDLDKKICIGRERENIATTRYSEPPKMGYQKLEANNPGELIPRGPLHSGTEDNSLGRKSKPEFQHVKPERAINANPPAMQKANFPSELKCPLCDTLFKEAVMMPCCQHSFCEKCICLVLAEKARCPRCNSSKCRAEDLLPNVSLRQAIESFLESNILICGSGNALYQYAPDGESRIQAKDISCAMTNLQRERALPDSPSPTGRGSNHIVAESACSSLLRNSHCSCGNHLGADKSLKSCSFLLKLKQIDGERPAHLVDSKSRPVDIDDFADCQGESQPIHGGVEFSSKKKRGNISDKGFMEGGRQRKVDRTCYMCGSPDHLIRDCPASMGPHPMLQHGNSTFPGAMPGYALCYWNGPPLLPVRPFANIYGNPGIMPFSATTFSAIPFVVPPHTPSMFGCSSAYGEYMRKGGPRTPFGIAADHPPQVFSHQEHEKNRRLSNKNLSEEFFDDDKDENCNKRYHSAEAERLRDPKSYSSKERSGSYYDESFTHRPHKRHQRDRNLDDDKGSVVQCKKNSRSSTPCREWKLYYDQDRSSSEVEDLPSGSRWHGDEGHKKHIRNSKKHHERMEQFCSDSSWICHPTNTQKEFERKRIKPDVEGHNQKHGSHSNSGLKPSCSRDRKMKHQEKDLSHVSRHNKCSSMDDKLSHDRWLMVRGSDEDGEEDHGFDK